MPRFHSDKPACLIDIDSGNRYALPGGLEIKATTLGELVRKLQEEHGICLMPEVGQKYFRMTRGKEPPQVLDLHVFKAGEEIYPKHDLSFAQLPDDVLGIAPMAC
ncbi:MAG: hypothetical protein RL095_2706 [Verrucomicrobiota bacterium]|jgi:hypothetical protein